MKLEDFKELTEKEKIEFIDSLDLADSQDILDDLYNLYHAKDQTERSFVNSLYEKISLRHNLLAGWDRYTSTLKKQKNHAHKI